MNDNVKFINELERLLNQKQNDYGPAVAKETKFRRAAVMNNVLLYPHQLHFLLIFVVLLIGGCVGVLSNTLVF